MKKYQKSITPDQVQRPPQPDSKCALFKVTHVFKENDLLWSHMLIRDSDKNFFLIQLLESMDQNYWWVWTRTGEEGLGKARPFSNMSEAKNIFKQTENIKILEGFL
eukprot:TRINITY_DN1312_c0_g1_i5.p1 TRINITY_DN1312_c0_g1~~TRINITY_DN1312_c0_g1_i5.p1  ORF type:complete len:106 (+),score=13.95 TRINITY_DN1312_c0_g1_i5:487-804(+)